MNIDFYVFQFINGFAGRWDWLDDLGVFFAHYFEYVLIVGVFLFLFKNFKKYRAIGLMLSEFVSSIILSRFVFTEIIRFIWHKPRPFVENNVNQLLYHANSAAFPSGHAAFYFALSATVYFYNKKAGFLFFYGTFLICLGRVFCGIHWPLDILAGAMVGIFSAWLINRLVA